MFFGIGPGSLNGSYFNEPLNAVYLLDFAHDYAYPGVMIHTSPSIGVPNTPFQFDNATQDGLAQARLMKLGDSLSFSVDMNYNGATFAPDLSGSLSISADLAFLDSSNSRIVFGSGAPTTLFHSLSIQAVPEPGSLALIILGLSVLICISPRFVARIATALARGRKLYPH